MAQYDKLINLGLLNQFLTKAKTIFAPKITASGILKGDGAGNVSAATAGTDYATPALVKVSDTQPTESENKLWVDTDGGSGNSYEVPTVAEMQAADALSAKADEIGIVITGARPSIVVSVGQYVIVRGSTITGITDGLYTAVNALSPSTDVTAADLAVVSGGGLNDLLVSNIGSLSFVSGVSTSEPFNCNYFESGHFVLVVLSDVTDTNSGIHVIATNVPKSAARSCVKVSNGSIIFVDSNSASINATGVLSNEYAFLVYPKAT